MYIKAELSEAHVSPLNSAKFFCAFSCWIKQSPLNQVYFSAVKYDYGMIRVPLQKVEYTTKVLTYIINYTV